MKLYFEDKATNGRFTLFINDPHLKGNGILDNKATTNTIIYNAQPDQTVVIDNLRYTLPANTVLLLMANQHFTFQKPEHLIAWQFNREFYCIADHDAEVGCVGFLFYGIRHPMFVSIAPADAEKITLMQQLCLEDMQQADGMQGEMLRTVLKRLIISLTRTAKKQTKGIDQITDEKMDLVRMFSLQLEVHFKTEHEVRFYANLLNRSPKTLANLFALLNYPTPSKLIQARLILEAKRYLQYTNMSAKEIAYALGFISPAHFSRFFKQHTGNSIAHYRNREL